MIPKFRAWDVELKSMKEVMDIDYRLECVELSDPDGDTYIQGFSNIKLMQPTGLTDKNGKEIFEGDILKFIDEWDEYCHEGYIDGSISGINYVEIETDSTSFIFGKTRIPDSSLFYCIYDERLTFQNLITDNELEFEVAGNIYENPELLEERT